MFSDSIDFKYSTPEMKRIWDTDNRYRSMIEVEVALSRAECIHGIIPLNDADTIESKSHTVSIEDIQKIDSEINHETMAVVKVLAKAAGDAGRWVHFGATSNDILDSATGLQLKESLTVLQKRLSSLISALLVRAKETADLVCIARTHGQHAIPTTYGMRFALWASELFRHTERLREILPRVAVGKMNGAVGTMAVLREKGIAVQETTMKLLGLSPVDISNQVVGRDRYAEYIFHLSGIATTLEKIGIELRTLQRTELGEVCEPHGGRQVGSSAMPHKINPVLCERICGLARVIRGMIEPALLNNTLWDERDLTNSSVERIILPDASVLTDYCINLMTSIIQGMKINVDAIKRNLNFLQGIILSESLVSELTLRGMPRLEAYDLVKSLSQNSVNNKIPLLSLAEKDAKVLEYLSKNELVSLINPYTYTGQAKELVYRIIEKLYIN